MPSKDCSTCAYGERYEDDLFWCHKRGTALFDSRAFEKVTNCGNWTSKKAFKLGRCSECRFSVYGTEEDTFTCYCDHRLLLSRPDNEKERENCSFCSPKAVEGAYTLTSLQHDVTTLMEVLEHTREYADWFTTNFPNGASSAEEVLSKLKDD